MRRQYRDPRCPACCLSPETHPACAPKHLRGTGLFCRPRYGFLHHAFIDGRWIDSVDAKIEQSDSWDDALKTACRQLGLLEAEHVAH